MSLLGDGAIAHGARVEALHDLRDGLDFLDRHRRASGDIEVEQVAQGDGTAGTVDDLAILTEEVHVTLGAGTLQEIDRARLDEVLLAVDRTPLRQAQARELVGRRALRKGHRSGIALVLLALDALDVEAAHARRGAREVTVNELVGKADDLEDLRGVVALHRRDAHLGHDRGDARGHGAVIVGDGLIAGKVDRTLGHEVTDALVRHIGVDAARGVAHEAGEVVRADGVAGLHHDVREHAHARTDEVVVDAAERE